MATLFQSESDEITTKATDENGRFSIAKEKITKYLEENGSKVISIERSKRETWRSRYLGNAESEKEYNDGYCVIFSSDGKKYLMEYQENNGFLQVINNSRPVTGEQIKKLQSNGWNVDDAFVPPTLHTKGWFKKRWEDTSSRNKTFSGVFRSSVWKEALVSSFKKSFGEVDQKSGWPLKEEKLFNPLRHLQFIGHFLTTTSILLPSAVLNGVHNLFRGYTPFNLLRRVYQIAVMTVAKAINTVVGYVAGKADGFMIVLGKAVQKQFFNYENEDNTLSSNQHGHADVVIPEESKNQDVHSQDLSVDDFLAPPSGSVNSDQLSNGSLVRMNKLFMDGKRENPGSSSSISSSDSLPEIHSSPISTNNEKKNIGQKIEEVIFSRVVKFII